MSILIKQVEYAMFLTWMLWNLLKALTHSAYKNRFDQLVLILILVTIVVTLLSLAHA